MDFVTRLTNLEIAVVPPWVKALGLFILIVAAGFLVQRSLLRLLTSLVGRASPFGRKVFERSAPLLRYGIVLVALAVALPLLPLSHRISDLADRILLAAFIVLLGWLALVCANILIDGYEGGFRMDAADNLEARKVFTQMRIFRRAINILVGTITLGFALMSFEGVRQFGVSLFASAGVAGIVAGLAARPMLENLIAGVQLALTQPLRLEDAVVIDKEWGWVEEINSTYIVVRLWDQRRQIVPLSYLFQTPFTNWTRSSSSLTGTVMLYLDYTMPMEALRAKVTELAKASPLWDGKVASVEVTESKEQVMEVRVLVSASNASRCWDLRCAVREKLISFIRQEHPLSLPHVRRQEVKPGSPDETAQNAG